MHRHSTMDSYYSLYLTLEMAYQMWRKNHNYTFRNFDEIKNQSMRRNENSIARWNEQVERIYKLRDKYLLPNGQEIKLENFTILDSSGVKDIAPGGACPFLGKEAWINPEGKFSPCCAPDELRSKLGDFGNVNDRTINEIWQSDTYRNLQKNYLNYDLCKACNMKKPLIS